MSYEEVEVYDDCYICETILWEARDKINPPHNGYVMFASSSPETNVPYLIDDMGIDPTDICVMIIVHNETVWYKKEESQ